MKGDVKTNDLIEQVFNRLYMFSPEELIFLSRCITTQIGITKANQQAIQATKTTNTTRNIAVSALNKQMAEYRAGFRDEVI
jgi:hypothetical protein